MTKLERRSIYWDMYVAAVGLAIMMTREEILYYNENINDYKIELPCGFCYMYERCIKFGNDMDEDLPELMKLEPRKGSCYWFRSSDWEPRAKLLLKAWEATFEPSKQTSMLQDKDNEQNDYPAFPIDKVPFLKTDMKWIGLSKRECYAGMAFTGVMGEYGHTRIYKNHARRAKFVSVRQTQCFHNQNNLYEYRTEVARCLKADH